MGCDVYDYDDEIHLEACGSMGWSGTPKKERRTGYAHLKVSGWW